MQSPGAGGDSRFIKQALSRLRDQTEQAAKRFPPLWHVLVLPEGETLRRSVGVRPVGVSGSASWSARLCSFGTSRLAGPLPPVACWPPELPPLYAVVAEHESPPPRPRLQKPYRVHLFFGDGSGMTAFKSLASKLVDLRDDLDRALREKLREGAFLFSNERLHGGRKTTCLDACLCTIHWWAWKATDPAIHTSPKIVFDGKGIETDWRDKALEERLSYSILPCDVFAAAALTIDLFLGFFDSPPNMADSVDYPESIPGAIRTLADCLKTFQEIWWLGEKAREAQEKSAASGPAFKGSKAAYLAVVAAHYGGEAEQKARDFFSHPDVKRLKTVCIAKSEEFSPTVLRRRCAEAAMLNGMTLDDALAMDVTAATDLLASEGAVSKAIADGNAGLSPTAAREQQGEADGASGVADPDFQRRFMEMAVEEARKSKPEDERAHPRVGVVVVKDGNVLATAYRGELGEGEHAEFTALEKKLCDVAVAGATVYTTLEPCTSRNHPKIPCASRLIERRVRRVVIGMPDPNRMVFGEGWARLREANVAIADFDSDLKHEIEEMNRDFIRCHKHTSTEQRSYEADRGPGPRDVEPTTKGEVMGTHSSTADMLRLRLQSLYAAYCTLPTGGPVADLAGRMQSQVNLQSQIADVEAELAAEEAGAGNAGSETPSTAKADKGKANGGTGLERPRKAKAEGTNARTADVSGRLQQLGDELLAVVTSCEGEDLSRQSLDIISEAETNGVFEGREYTPVRVALRRWRAHRDEPWEEVIGHKPETDPAIITWQHIVNAMYPELADKRELDANEKEEMRRVGLPGRKEGKCELQLWTEWKEAARRIATLLLEAAKRGGVAKPNGRQGEGEGRSGRGPRPLPRPGPGPDRA